MIPRSKLQDAEAQENKAAARVKIKAMVEEPKQMKLIEAAKKTEDSIDETLIYMVFPISIGLESAQTTPLNA